MLSFSGANLKGARLDGSQMTGVNLRVANLKGASMQNCVLHDGILAGADLEVWTSDAHCFLKYEFTIREQTLEMEFYFSLQLAYFILIFHQNCNLTGCDLQGANLRGANVVGTVFLNITTPLHMVHLM